MRVVKCERPVTVSQKTEEEKEAAAEEGIGGRNRRQALVSGLASAVVAAVGRAGPHGHPGGKPGGGGKGSNPG